MKLAHKRRIQDESHELCLQFSECIAVIIQNIVKDTVTGRYCQSKKMKMKIKIKIKIQLSEQVVTGRKYGHCKNMINIEKCGLK